MQERRRRPHINTGTICRNKQAKSKLRRQRKSFTIHVILNYVTVLSQSLVCLRNVSKSLLPRFRTILKTKSGLYECWRCFTIIYGGRGGVLLGNGLIPYTGSTSPKNPLQWIKSMVSHTNKHKLEIHWFYQVAMNSRRYQ